MIFLNFGTPPLVKSMPTNASICDKKTNLFYKEEAAVTREWLEVALKEASKAEVRMFEALI